jgi:hypothetical protein
LLELPLFAPELLAALALLQQGLLMLKGPGANAVNHSPQ